MLVSVLAKNTCVTTGEGPFWEESTKSLLYVDILAGDVHRWNTTTNSDSKIHLGMKTICCVRLYTEFCIIITHSFSYKETMNTIFIHYLSSYLISFYLCGQIT